MRSEEDEKMSKGHLPVIAKIQDPATLKEMEILAGRDGTHVAEVYAGTYSGEPMPLTRDQLVSLRDQINAWLMAKGPRMVVSIERRSKWIVADRHQGIRRDLPARCGRRMTQRSWSARSGAS